MKYLLLIYSEEGAWSEAEREKCYGESLELVQSLQEAGQFIAASPLQPVTTATSIRIREGKRLVTDGPFAETHEQLGGYFLIDVPDLNAAMEVASRIPAARRGTVEIRPIVELPGLQTT